MMLPQKVCARCGETRGVIQLELSGVAGGMCHPCLGVVQGSVDRLGSLLLAKANETAVLATEDVSARAAALDKAVASWLVSQVLFFFLHLADRDAFGKLDDQLRVLFSRFLADTALVKLIASWGIGKNDARYGESFQMVRSGLNSIQIELGLVVPTCVAGAFRSSLVRLLAKTAPSAHAALAAAIVQRASDTWQHIAPAVQRSIAATRSPTASTDSSLSSPSRPSATEPSAAHSSAEAEFRTDFLLLLQRYRLVNLNWEVCGLIQVSHLQAHSWVLNIPTSSVEREHVLRWSRQNRLPIDAELSDDAATDVRLEGFNTEEVVECVLSLLAALGVTDQVVAAAYWEVSGDTEQETTPLCGASPPANSPPAQVDPGEIASWLADRLATECSGCAKMLVSELAATSSDTAGKKSLSKQFELEFAFILCALTDRIATQRLTSSLRVAFMTGLALSVAQRLTEASAAEDEASALVERVSRWRVAYGSAQTVELVQYWANDLVTRHRELDSERLRTLAVDLGSKEWSSVEGEASMYVEGVKHATTPEPVAHLSAPQKTPQPLCPRCSRPKPEPDDLFPVCTDCSSLAWKAAERVVDAIRKCADYTAKGVLEELPRAVADEVALAVQREVFILYLFKVKLVEAKMVRQMRAEYLGRLNAEAIVRVLLPLEVPADSPKFVEDQAMNRLGELIAERERDYGASVPRELAKCGQLVCAHLGEAEVERAPHIARMVGMAWGQVHDHVAEVAQLLGAPGHG